MVLPAPHGSAPPGRRDGDRLVVDGIASARIDRATTVLIAIADDSGTAIASVEAAALSVPGAGGLDPVGAYRRVRTEVALADATTFDADGTWTDAVALARTALAHELIASARTMLDHARNRIQEAGKAWRICNPAEMAIDDPVAAISDENVAIPTLAQHHLPGNAGRGKRLFHGAPGCAEAKGNHLYR